MDSVGTVGTGSVQLTKIDSSPRSQSTGPIDKGGSNTPSSRTTQNLSSKTMKIDSKEGSDKDQKSEVHEKRGLSHWGFKVAGALAFAGGVALMATGIGSPIALLGAVLVCGGLLTASTSMFSSAVDAGVQAEENGTSIGEAVGWDIAKGLAQFAFPIAIIGGLFLMIASDGDLPDGGGGGGGGSGS
ncbi:MAG: hypothetical protein AAGC81_18845, partial [Pseudomonadota bacterium]